MKFEAVDHGTKYHFMYLGRIWYIVHMDTVFDVQYSLRNDRRLASFATPEEILTVAKLWLSSDYKNQFDFVDFANGLDL